jgi:Carboxypeptidase regulatory-like domain
MSRYIKTFIVTLAIASTGSVGMHAAAVTGGVSGISGSISDRARLPLAGVAVPLRNIENGEIVARTRTDRAGRFSFSGLHAGHYIVEVVGTSGDLVAASAPVSVRSGKRPVNPVFLSVATGPRAAFSQTGSVRPVFSTIEEIIRAAIRYGIHGSSIKNILEALDKYFDKICTSAYKPW